MRNYYLDLKKVNRIEKKKKDADVLINDEKEN
jgi:hypothetical protein